MGNRKNKITDITVGLTIVIGLAFSGYLKNNSAIPLLANLIITFFVSAFFNEVLFWVLIKTINRFDLFLKMYWGKTYVKGYWSYTYVINGIKKYGAWCIDQDIDTITIKGFGLTKDGVRRSDVQSLTSLISRGNDYEVVNMRRDISDNGVMSDTFYYSKTVLHFHQRVTFMNLFNYPLAMDGTTYIYGGSLSGNTHTQLVFKKHIEAKDERGIEQIVTDMIP